MIILKRVINYVHFYFIFFLNCVKLIWSKYFTLANMLSVLFCNVNVNVSTIIYPITMIVHSQRVYKCGRRLNRVIIWRRYKPRRWRQSNDDARNNIWITISYHTMFEKLIFKHCVSLPNALFLDSHGRKIPSFYLRHVSMQNHFR